MEDRTGRRIELTRDYSDLEKENEREQGRRTVARYGDELYSESSIRSLACTVPLL